MGTDTIPVPKSDAQVAACLERIAQSGEIKALARLFPFGMLTVEIADGLALSARYIPDCRWKKPPKDK